MSNPKNLPNITMNGTCGEFLLTFGVMDTEGREVKHSLEMMYCVGEDTVTVLHNGRKFTMPLPELMFPDMRGVVWILTNTTHLEKVIDNETHKKLKQAGDFIVDNILGIKSAIIEKLNTKE